MTQGDPLAMASYDIGFLPLIKRLKLEYTYVTQPWYADDAVALCTFDNIGLYFISLKKFSLGRGYYLKPSKIVLIVHPDNLATRKRFGLHHRFKVCTGAHYLGGFIEDDKSRRYWLKDRTSK